MNNQPVLKSIKRKRMIKRKKRNFSAGGSKHNASHPLLQVNHERVYFTWRAFAPSVRFRPRQTNLLLVFAIGTELSLRSEWLVGVPTVLLAVHLARGLCSPLVYSGCLEIY